MPSAAPRGRDLRLDVFRGLALIMIFVNHVPNNPLSLLTSRRFGFSDAAEVFVFISGCAAGIVYGRVLVREGTQAARAKTLRRIGKLYGAHLALLLAFVAVVVYCTVAFSTTEFWIEANLGSLFAQQPLGALSALALLAQPAFMNILPMYIIVLGLFALALPWLKSHPVRLLLVSGGLYGLVTLTGLAPPVQGTSHWYFNPLAWQILFMLGAVVGAAPIMARRWLIETPAIRRILTGASLFYLGGALTLVMIPRLTALPDLLAISINDADLLAWKADLAPPRLLHVLALIYLTARVVPPSAAWLRGRAAQLLALCGRHALEVFCAGTLLAFIGRVAIAILGHDLPIVLGVNGVGVLGLVATAWALERQRANSPQAPRALVGPAGVRECLRQPNTGTDTGTVAWIRLPRA